MNQNHKRSLGVRLWWVMCLIGVLPITVLAQTSTVTRTSSFEYDAQGLLIKEVIEPDRPADCLQTTYSYDTFGNRTQGSTRACGGGEVRSTSNAYEAQSVVVNGASLTVAAGQFATRSTNALGQSETKKYDPRHGGLLELTGPNGLITRWDYDGFGRKTREIRADGTYTTWEYRFCGQNQSDGAAAPCSSGGLLNNHTTAWYVAESQYSSTNAVLAPRVFQIHDSLDRVIRTRTLDFAGEVVVQDTVYNALGQVQRKSVLYRISGGNPQWSSFEYDALGRVMAQTEPDGNGGQARTTISYNGLSNTVTNAKGQNRTTVKNAMGQVDRIVDHQDSVVSYRYDALGNLIETNASGSVTRLAYDQRGRKVRMEDPAMGVWDYRYNVFGELIAQTDSLGQTTTMAYDALGRMVRRDEPDLKSTWRYDTASNGVACGKSVGKLCEASADNGYRRAHQYDSLGRQQRTETTLNSAASPMAVSQTYEPSTGRLASQTWPSGYVATYGYTARGHLGTVNGRTPQGAAAASITILAMNPQGQVTQYRQGNSVTTFKNIDEATGRVKSIQATAANQSSGNVFNHSYGYDALGNLTSRSDTNTGVSESFQYDTINRLTLYTAVGGSLSVTQGTQVLYDRAGNIRYKSDVGYYNYDPERPNRIAGVSNDPNSGNWSQGVVGAVNPAYRYSGQRYLAYQFDDARAEARTMPSTGRKMGNGNLWYTVSHDHLSGRHTVRWETYTSFNMPREILFGNVTQPSNPTATVAERKLSYTYGPEHQRVRMTTEFTGNAPSHMREQAGTTWYLNGQDSQGLLFEREIRSDGRIEDRHFLSAAGVTFAVAYTRSANWTSPQATRPPQEVHYWHHDHLGSVAAVSNTSGQVIERMAYDPWGKRRNTNGLGDPLDQLWAQTTDRGYTQHEHLDEVGVIHMNGRIYDPLMGRFMSADPFIQAPYNLQSFNRYSYVLNNPLRFVDPTGYWTDSEGNSWSSGDGSSIGTGFDSGGYTEASTEPGVVSVTVNPNDSRYGGITETIVWADGFYHVERESWDGRNLVSQRLESGYLDSSFNISSGGSSGLGDSLFQGGSDALFGGYNLQASQSYKQGNYGWALTYTGAAVLMGSSNFVSGGLASVLGNVSRQGAGALAAKANVWGMSPFVRGREIEKALGQNLPGNFPTIDRFSNGIATSIKSLDVNAATYQNAAALSRTVSGYIDSIANFSGRSWAGVSVPGSSITGRALDLAVPGKGSTVQQNVFDQAVQYGASRGVTVNVITFP